MISRPWFVGLSSRALAACIVFAATPQVRAWAGNEVLAVTGDAQPGNPGALLLGVSAGAINDAGQVAFQATLHAGAGGVNAANDQTVWKIVVSSREVIAREGMTAPGGGQFASFQKVSIDDSGGVAMRASLVSDQIGLWRVPSMSSGAVAARTVDFGVAGVDDARLETLDFRFLHAPGDVIAYSGTMIDGLGGVTNDNNRAAWIDDAGEASLM